MLQKDGIEIEYLNINLKFQWFYSILEKINAETAEIQKAIIICIQYTYNIQIHKYTYI